MIETAQSPAAQGEAGVKVPLPKGFAALHNLGRPLDVYPLRRRWLATWASLLLGCLAWLGAAGALFYGAWLTLQRYYAYGPAVLLRTATPPAAAALALLGFGALLLVAAYRNWPVAAALFDQGLAYRDRSGLQVWRWSEIEGLRANVTRHYFNGIYTRTTRHYELVHRDGSRLALGDRLKRVEMLMANVRERVVPALYARDAQAFNQGQPLEYGAVTVSKAGGLTIGRKSFAWDEIGGVTVREGLLRIRPNSDAGSRREIKLPVAQILNLEVLVSILDQLVAVKVE